MLSMLIADDEKVIRESLADCFDWGRMGIQITACCSNGIEALETIIDSSPAIVMTDIKMPGLSGLELIRRIQEIDSDTEFIILSGYREFEFAKQALQYGVRRYLLKPLSETQLFEAVQDAKENYEQKRDTAQALLRQRQLQEEVRMHQRRLLMYEMFSGHSEEQLPHQFSGAAPSAGGTYTAAYYSFVQKSHLQAFCKQVYHIFETHDITPLTDLMYVKNSVAVLLEGSSPQRMQALEQALETAGNDDGIAVAHQQASFSSLEDAVLSVRRKLIRYPKIWTIGNDLTVLELYNEATASRKINSLLQQLTSDEMIPENGKAATLTASYFSPIDDTGLLRSSGAHLLSHLAYAGPEKCETKSYLSETLDMLYRAEDASEIRKLIQDAVLFLLSARQSADDSLIHQVKVYVEEHLSDANLSLKRIATQHIHMNVDYLSRLFVKQTGEKFSHYLNRRRVEIAQKYMRLDASRIHEIAEQVGCGHNPRYFSQVFKKYTGMTPTAYITKCQSAEKASSLC